MYGLLWSGGHCLLLLPDGFRAVSVRGHSGSPGHLVITELKRGFLDESNHSGKAQRVLGLLSAKVL